MTNVNVFHMEVILSRFCKHDEGVIVDKESNGKRLGKFNFDEEIMLS